MNIKWTTWDGTNMLRSLCRTHTIVLSLWDTCARNNSYNITINSSLGMKTFYLKFIELDKELFDELIKHIVAFAHKFGCLFFCHLTRFIYLRLFKVRKDENKDLLCISRNLYKVYRPTVTTSVIWNLMEVAIQYLPFLSHSLFIVAYVHWRRAFCSN